MAKIIASRVPRDPYVRAAVSQFSPKPRTLTQRLLEELGFVISA